MTSEPVRSNGMRWDNTQISPSKLGLWMKCPAAFYFNYIKRIQRDAKVFFPQGTAVHYGVELLNQDLAKGTPGDEEYYAIKMDDVWQDELHQNNGKFFDFKGNLLTPEQLEYHFNETVRWFGMYYRAARTGAIPDFDATTVKETELDLMREVIHYEHGPLGVSVRGKIDWVIDLDGPVARLADLKTASTSWMARWGTGKADGQLQATAYGYASGKPLDFSYVVIPKAAAKDAASTPIEHYRTQRDEKHYRVFEDTMLNFVRQTDVLNNYDGFIPFPNPEPSQHSHCGKLCDFKAECRKEFFGG